MIVLLSHSLLQSGIWLKHSKVQTYPSDAPLYLINVVLSAYHFNVKEISNGASVCRNAFQSFRPTFYLVGVMIFRVFR